MRKEIERLNERAKEFEEEEATDIYNNIKGQIYMLERLLKLK